MLIDYANLLPAAFTTGKLHTGRSRNDQVATDMRIWLLEQVEKLEQFLKDVIRVLVSRAEGEIDHVMPGYTHLQVRGASISQLTKPKLISKDIQRAQPIRWSHFLLSHVAFFINDLKRLQDLKPRISVLPLGSGPLAGNPFTVPRDLLQKELGFQSLTLNSMQVNMFFSPRCSRADECYRVLQTETLSQNSSSGHP